MPLSLQTTRELFPLIERTEEGRGGKDDHTDFCQLRTRLQADHINAGQSFQILRIVTDRYDLPARACATLRSLFQGLNEFEQLMQLHVHLENNVLFPRAAALLSEARN